MSNWTYPFSFPHEGVDEALFDTVAITHAQSVTAWLTTTYRDEIAGSGNNLLEYLLEWMNGMPRFDTVWDLAFGRAQLSLKKGWMACGPIGVHVGLRLAESGYSGEWQARMRPSTVRLGNLFLPNVAEADVSVDSDSARIVLRRTDGIERRPYQIPQTGTWKCEGATCLASVGINRPVYLYPGEALIDEALDSTIFEGVRPVRSVDSSVVNCFQEGFGKLARYAPEYLHWVERVVHGILVCPHEDGFRVVSGSAEDAPGILHVSYPLSPMDIAEILVHESAHQYFYLLQRAGPVDNGTDQELYWSPPIRKKRPLSRILMAYHALANVRTLYEAVDGDNASDTAYVNANREQLEEFVSVLDGPLRNNPALTELGRGLYEPLAERLAAITGATHRGEM
jgi:HEXXH motif-containing protein